MAIHDVPWNPGTITFIFDQRVPYCPRQPNFQRDIDRITKRIVKGAHGYRKREEIEQWMIANYRTSREFALGEATAFGGWSKWEFKYSETQHNPPHSREQWETMFIQTTGSSQSRKGEQVKKQMET
jgi:hypothetical protein